VLGCGLVFALDHTGVSRFVPGLRSRLIRFVTGALSKVHTVAIYAGYMVYRSALLRCRTPVSLQ
jgi:hypothetical protein